ncbi:MAG: hypothetical protein UY26_C0004G0023 [Candidatus Jorgensenbacteria bacterium GW2011_GWA1_48_13]|uniref:Uncharacterized protein n=2 Tax=Candidatus Joergenseniibacteriota TaxID=1752739 RepID=A0A0G1W846_9BACT|nr:MAG: hypothetical protein UY26_C0004G0023 [Candidatus Jorgensenbacteria bacterium GW2011_GWA1_48_13]KKW14770.1 MAG: hypothetical protein UY55_C0004G0023 [Candidatus Jorgensenbacteria bacterium GW2011_GWB1_50_10]
MPDVDVRTFGSDVKSMADTGGGAPKPYQPAAPAESQPVPQEEKKPFGEVFETPGEVSPVPAEMPPAGMQEFGAAPKFKKGLFAGLLVLIIVVGLGAIGYFYVYPTFFGGVSEIESPPPAAQEPASPQTPTPPIVPQVPVVGGETTTMTSTATTTEEITPSPSQTLLEHKSLFKTAADVSTNITLGIVSISSIKGQLEFSTAQVPILKEIIFKNSDGEILSASGVMGAFLPDVFSATVSADFENDLTLATYTNDKGTWPVIVLKLRSGSSLTEAKTTVQKIETSANLPNFFITDPGTASAWKNGTTEGVSNRYRTFSLSGAGLNYGWTGDTLVISSSYAGFQEALKRLR